jgi:drug/metabolite transporter (DMT)-like permease
MFTNVKVLYNETNISSFEIVFVRGLSDLILTTILWQSIGVNVLEIEIDQRNAIRIRMFFAAASAFFVFLTYQVNPLSIATTLSFTSPIFTSIFAFIAIGERLTRYDIINMVSWIIGVLLVSNPFGDAKGNTTIMGVLIGIMAAVMIAGSFTMVRIVAINFHFMIPMFYYWLATTAFAPLGYLVLLFIGHQPNVYTSDDLMRLLVLWIFGFFSQFFLSASYKLEKAGRVSSVRYLQIVLSFLVDVMVFKTSFSIQEIIGTALILTTNLGIVVLKWTGKIK